jgi:hypothetical protein
MIPPVALCVLAGVTFLEQDIPGLSAGEINPLNGQVAANYLHVDVDGDGVVDLVLPAEVRLQRDGTFPEDARIAFPDGSTVLAFDVWNNEFYLRLAGRLKVVYWHEGEWKTKLAQQFRWAEPDQMGRASSQEGQGGPSGAQHERFLHDFDADDVPEIVLAAPDGLHLYRRTAAEFVEACCLDVLPPLSIVGLSDQALWPAAARRISLPVRAMNCGVYVTGLTVGVLTEEALPARQVRYRLTRYTVDPENNLLINSASARTEETAPMPNYVRPCRLNRDDRIDYAGGDWELSEASVFPAPIYETYATLDQGRASQTVRTRSFRPHCSFVDFDGDGDLDMVTESTRLFEGGGRESVSRFLTGREVVHEFNIHLQNPKNGFSDTPDIVGRFTIRLDAAPCRNSDMFRRYLAGELCNITGDIDGDHYRDLVIQDGPQRLSVYLFKGTGFAGKPDLSVPLEKGTRFAVADVNGDGLSDLITCKLVESQGTLQEVSRVYFTRWEKD